MQKNLMARGGADAADMPPSLLFPTTLFLSQHVSTICYHSCLVFALLFIMPGASSLHFHLHFRIIRPAVSVLLVSSWCTFFLLSVFVDLFLYTPKH